MLAAAQAAVIHIAHYFSRAHVYVVGEQPLFDLACANGLQIANSSSQKVDVVLVGLDRAFDYKKLTEAILAVRAGARFMAINRDSLLPIENGFIAGCGTIVAAIEAGSGITPEVVGKPQPMLLQEALSLLDSQPEETVMIGDGLASDILAGKTAGTRTLLVLSGKDSRVNIEKTGIMPDFVYSSLAAVMQEIGHQGS